MRGNEWQHKQKREKEQRREARRGETERSTARRIRYCVRQPRRRREGERGLDRRAFKVTTVCYPTCCGHVTSRMEGMKGRPLPSRRSVSSLPPLLSSVSKAGAEHSSAAGHLALVAYTVSDFARLLPCLAGPIVVHYPV